MAPYDLACLVLMASHDSGVGRAQQLYWGLRLGTGGRSYGYGLCNRYSITTNQEAVRSPGKAVSEHAPLVALSSKERATDRRPASLGLLQ